MGSDSLDRRDSVLLAATHLEPGQLVAAWPVWACPEPRRVRQRREPVALPSPEVKQPACDAARAPHRWAKCQPPSGPAERAQPTGPAKSPRFASRRSGRTGAPSPLGGLGYWNCGLRLSEARRTSFPNSLIQAGLGTPHWLSRMLHGTCCTGGAGRPYSSIGYDGTSDAAWTTRPTGLRARKKVAGASLWRHPCFNSIVPNRRPPSAFR